MKVVVADGDYRGRYCEKLKLGDNLSSGALKAGRKAEFRDVWWDEFKANLLVKVFVGGFA